MKWSNDFQFFWKTKITNAAASKIQNAQSYLCMHHYPASSVIGRWQYWRIITSIWRWVAGLMLWWTISCNVFLWLRGANWEVGKAPPKSINELPPSSTTRSTTLVRALQCICGSHGVLAVWNLSKQNNWCRRENVEIRPSSHQKKSTGGNGDGHVLLGSEVPCPFNLFFYKGQNYLQKILSDLDFVGKIMEAISFLGLMALFHRNHFHLALNVNQLGGHIGPHKMASVWRDDNMPRF